MKQKKEYRPMYRMYIQLLTMIVHLNVSYYDSKQNYSNSSHTDRLDICECALVSPHLNDLANCHNKTHLTEQALSVGEYTPCIVLKVNPDGYLHNWLLIQVILSQLDNLFYLVPVQIVSKS